jgi:hypothetical protein
VTLDEALDELYGAPLDAFVAERKRLAKELPADERGDFTALRKPSIAAWTLNQLARQHRRDVDLLLDAGHRMRQAGLDKAAVDRARASESDAIKRLMRAAEQLGASAQALTKVNESLRAAAVSEEGRELLARGRTPASSCRSGRAAVERSSGRRPRARAPSGGAPKPSSSGSGNGNRRRRSGRMRWRPRSRRQNADCGSSIRRNRPARRRVVSP